MKNGNIILEWIQFNNMKNISNSVRKKRQKKKENAEMWEGLRLLLLALKMEEEGHVPRNVAGL